MNNQPPPGSMPEIFLITGNMAAGKSTVAAILAYAKERSAPSDGSGRGGAGVSS